MIGIWFWVISFICVTNLFKTDSQAVPVSCCSLDFTRATWCVCIHALPIALHGGIFLVVDQYLDRSSVPEIELLQLTICRFLFFLELPNSGHASFPAASCMYSRFQMEQLDFSPNDNQKILNWLMTHMSVLLFCEKRAVSFVTAPWAHWVSCPGRTFLGKRRYFSGIAALTPLTPLTYKQNAVNAFIPTKKTPLTPLYRQGTPLTLLYQKKLVSSKNWFSHSVKNEKLTVNHLVDKRLRSF